MPPPEVWGPAVWRLFHTLAERINEHAYPHLSKQLFQVISGICKFLPCPDCSSDAVRFLAKIKIEDLKTKTDFKNMLYLFHNYVNVKKRKPLFNYANMNVYKNYRLLPIFNNFVIHYNTKGNMRLLTESFQRQFVIKGCRKWLFSNIHFFIPSPSPIPSPLQNPSPVQNIKEEPVEVEVEVKEEEEEDSLQIPETSEEVYEQPAPNTETKKKKKNRNKAK